MLMYSKIFNSHLVDFFDISTDPINCIIIDTFGKYFFQLTMNYPLYTIYTLRA